MKKYILLKTFLIIAVSFALLTSAASNQTKTITIGLDLSGSNALLTHPNFAQGAAHYIAEEITQLNHRDTVQLLTFGARENTQNLVKHKVVLGRRARPQKVAKQMSQFIASLPEQAKTIKQSSTNLVGWLELKQDEFDCAGNGQIIVITDGIESSEFISAKDLLSGKKSLPKAEANLKGCHITFYGLGIGLPVSQVKRLRGEWQNWSEQTGASFQAIIP